MHKHLKQIFSGVLKSEPGAEEIIHLEISVELVIKLVEIYY